MPIKMFPRFGWCRLDFIVWFGWSDGRDAVSGRYIDKL
jgi:hypothetical protein